MSKWLVKQREFIYKKKKKSFRKMMNRNGISIPDFKISKKIKNILSWWTIFIFIIIVWIFIIIKLSFFWPEKIISQVKFSEDTIATYNDIELFNLISNEVKGKNYYIINSNKEKILSKIQNWFTVKSHSWSYVASFPFVWDINFQLEETSLQETNDTSMLWVWFPIELSPNLIKQIKPTVVWQFPLSQSLQEQEIWWTLWIELSFYEPKVLVTINDKQFAVWNEETYVELKEWMLLWIRIPTEENNYEPLFVIETPQYLSWTTSLDWFFFELSLNDMLEIISLAKYEFPDMKRFVYLAWSTRIAIFTSDDKVLYFNFPQWRDINEQWNIQIAKYRILKERYSNFHNIENINLWALEENKVIIKKY